MNSQSAYRLSAKEQLAVARLRRDLAINHLIMTTGFSKRELMIMAECELVFFRLHTLLEARQACKEALARLLREACEGPLTLVDPGEPEPCTLRSAQLQAA